MNVAIVSVAPGHTLHPREVYLLVLPLVSAALGPAQQRVASPKRFLQQACGEGGRIMQLSSFMYESLRHLPNLCAQVSLWRAGRSVSDSGCANLANFGCMLCRLQKTLSLLIED